MQGEERESFIVIILVRVHFIIVMIRWTGLAPWAFEFSFPGSLTSTFLGAGRTSSLEFSKARQKRAPRITAILSRSAPAGLAGQGWCGRRAQFPYEATCSHIGRLCQFLSLTHTLCRPLGVVGAVSVRSNLLRMGGGVRHTLCLIANRESGHLALLAQFPYERT